MFARRTEARRAAVVASALVLLLPLNVLAGEPTAEAVAYTTSAGFSPVDVKRVNDDLAAVFKSGTPMTAAEVSLIEKALLVLEAREPALTRVRYALSFSEQTIGATKLSFVDVQRYNLGPATFQDAVASYGAENVSDPSAFGIGPHVAWRLVSQHTADATAAVMAASRREITEADAASARCPVRSCVALGGFDDLANWTELPVPNRTAITSPYPAIFAYNDGRDTIEEVTVAYQALRLLLASGYAKEYQGSVLWKLPVPADAAKRTPRLTLIIDRNLGQDTISDAALGILNDTGETADRWIRMSSAVSSGEMQLFWSTSGPLKSAP